jgi:elongation factor 2
MRTSDKKMQVSRLLIVYISRMIPTPDRSRFFAFGRIFAGTVTAGMAVRILGPSFVPGSKADSYSISDTTDEILC